MTDTVSESAIDPVAARRATLMRLATGLIQGLLLYGLYKASEAKVWPATHKELFSALCAVAFFTPFLSSPMRRPVSLVSWLKTSLPLPLL